MKTTIVFLFFISNFTVSAQIVPSTCQSSDSIRETFRADASRLALRHTYKFAETYKDSVKINAQLQKRYQDALVAVYNATALAVHDTLFRMLKLRTNPVPEMNNMNVKAAPSLLWMQELYNNVPPSSSPTINALMQRYNMQYTYLQSTLYDVIIFKTDTCLNLPIQSPLYTGQGAISATPETGYDDVRNITDSLNANFIVLDYSYGWGTCNNGCDQRKNWKLKVYTDCSVEYLGSTGPSLFLGITPQDKSLLPQLVNPVCGEIIIRNLKEPVLLSLMSSDGRIIFTKQTDGSGNLQLPSTVSPGLYLLNIQGVNVYKTERLIVID